MQKSRKRNKATPQPDYSIAFKREAFTDEQLSKIDPIIGDFIAGDQSLVMATSEMYFPFFACEVSAGALQYADCQNLHTCSMTLAMRAIVDLHRLVNRESELHLQILAFSISHNHETVRIYGHYPVIDKTETKYYQHLISKCSFTDLNGKDKWTAYQFTLNVYDRWVPMHLAIICLAIDQIQTQPESNNSQELENADLAPLGDEKPTMDSLISRMIAKPARKLQFLQQLERNTEESDR